MRCEPREQISDQIRGRLLREGEQFVEAVGDNDHIVRSSLGDVIAPASGGTREVDLSKDQLLVGDADPARVSSPQGSRLLQRLFGPIDSNNGQFCEGVRIMLVARSIPATSNEIFVAGK